LISSFREEQEVKKHSNEFNSYVTKLKKEHKSHEFIVSRHTVWWRIFFSGNIWCKKSHNRRRKKEKYTLYTCATW